MAQLVGRKSAPAQARTLQAAGNDLLDPARRQPLAGLLGNKQCLLVAQVGQGSAGGGVMLQRIQAGGRQVDEPFLAALAGNADGIVPKIAQIDGHQLGQTHTAVQKQRYNAEIALVKITLYIF